MITAFQRSAYQDNAFQIGLTVGGGGERWTGLHLLWLRAKEEADRKRREEEALQVAELTAPLEVVTALAAPIVTDLSALVAAPKPIEAVAAADLRKADDERALNEFIAFMVKIAQAEEEC